jgi:hypothetical protein
MAAIYILENRRIESAKFGLVALVALMYSPEARHVPFEATLLWIAYAHGVSRECTWIWHMCCVHFSAILIIWKYTLRSTLFVYFAIIYNILDMANIAFCYCHGAQNATVSLWRPVLYCWTQLHFFFSWCIHQVNLSWSCKMRIVPRPFLVLLYAGRVVSAVCWNRLLPRSWICLFIPLGNLWSQPPNVNTVYFAQTVWFIGVGGQCNGPPKNNLVSEMVNIVFSLVNTVATARVMWHLLLIFGLHWKATVILHESLSLAVVNCE